MDGRDEELLQVYAEEARERLGAMTTLLLQLDSTQDDPELMAALFREAHSLKGGAAMVGLEAVATGSTTEGWEWAASEPAELAASESTTEVLESAATEPAEPAESPGSAAAGPTASAQLSGSTQERLAVPIDRLDELVRLVGETVAGQLRLGVLLRQSLGRDPEGTEEFRSFTHILQELQGVAMRTRMVPVSRAVPGLQRAVRELARAQGKQVRCEVLGGETELDRRVLDQL